MWEHECKKAGECGLNQGMPEYKDIPSPKESSGNCGVDDTSPKWYQFNPSAVDWEAVLGDTGFRTPYEFLPNERWKDFQPVDNVNLNKVCREVVEDLVKEKSALEGFHEEVRRRYPRVDWYCPGDGVNKDDGEPITLDGVRDWIKNGPPGSIKWENTEPVTYHGAKEAPTQVGGTHYAEMSVQPWDAMRAWMSPAEYAGYHVGTVIGYLSRHKKKGALQDILKAKHHLEELVRYFEEDEEYPW
jgi:hypothetical protein